MKAIKIHPLICRCCTHHRYGGIYHYYDRQHMYFVGFNFVDFDYRVGVIRLTNKHWTETKTATSNAAMPRNPQVLYTQK